MPWIHYLRDHGINVIYALSILIIGTLIARAVRKQLQKAFRSHPKDLTVKLFAINAGYATTLLAIIISALARLGVPTASLITVLGAMSLTIGLALKDSLSHVAAGLLLVTLKPFRIGDSVEIGGIMGTIRKIDLFTTCIHTEEGEICYIPNSKIMNDKIITNITAKNADH